MAWTNEATNQVADPLLRQQLLLSGFSASCTNFLLHFASLVTLACTFLKWLVSLATMYLMQYELVSTTPNLQNNGAREHNPLLNASKASWAMAIYTDPRPEKSVLGQYSISGCWKFHLEILSGSQNATLKQLAFTKLFPTTFTKPTNPANLGEFKDA